MGVRRTCGRLLAVICAAVAVLVFEAVPAWAAPSIVVSPSTDLVDGQTVAVSGAGFAPNAFLGVAMCEPNPTSTSDCDLNPLVLLNADSTGSFSTNFTVRRFISTSNANTDCASAAGACVLVAGEPDLNPVATAPLSFDPDAPAIPPLDLTFVLSDRAVFDRRTGGVVLSGTATCNREAPVSVFGTLSEVTPDGVASGSFSGFGSCDEDGETVWVTAQPTEGTFKPGRAVAQGSASASDVGDFVSRNISSVVQIARSK